MVRLFVVWIKLIPRTGVESFNSEIVADPCTTTMAWALRLKGRSRARAAMVVPRSSLCLSGLSLTRSNRVSAHHRGCGRQPDDGIVWAPMQTELLNRRRRNIRVELVGAASSSTPRSFTTERVGIARSVCSHRLSSSELTPSSLKQSDSQQTGQHLGPHRATPNGTSFGGA